MLLYARSGPNDDGRALHDDRPFDDGGALMHHNPVALNRNSGDAARDGE